MASEAVTRLITADELLAMGEGRRELVEGVVREMVPPGYDHGKVAAKIATAEHSARVGPCPGYWPGAPDLAVEVVSPGYVAPGSLIAFADQQPVDCAPAMPGFAPTAASLLGIRKA